MPANTSVQVWAPDAAENEKTELKEIYNKIYPVNSETSPLWNRDYAQLNNTEDCNRELNDIMHKLDITNIIVGHTKVNESTSSKCGGRIYFADCHASKAFDITVDDNNTKRSTKYVHQVLRQNARSLYILNFHNTQYVVIQTNIL